MDIDITTTTTPTTSPSPPTAFMSAPAASWPVAIVLAWVALIWYIFVWAICILGYTRLYRQFKQPPPPLRFVHEDDVPFVSILRPVKGFDPNLDLCLSSTCLLDYPRSRFELVICVASADDAAIPAINHVMEKFPDVQTVLKIGEEDVGPNPKIRNLSQAYREAAGDIVWILDCNVWVAPGILRRSVDALEGAPGRPGYKLVHHLPVAVDVTAAARPVADPLLEPDAAPRGWLARALSFGGGRLEEAFLSSSHAKFYTAINALAVAPCVVGKSSMHRRSHLREATRDGARPGIAYFAEYICEDQLLGEKLWTTPLAEERGPAARAWHRHHLGADAVYQPLEAMGVADYLARRTRWVRVRKYANLPATFAEALTESFTASLVGAYAATTLPPLARATGASWAAFAAAWLASVGAWALCDRLLFNLIHRHASTSTDADSPGFLVGRKGRALGAWALQWTGREFFAFWVWLAALWPGPVNWRGRLYKIRWADMKVEEMGSKRKD